jgi:mannose-6-phosphate isomerase-like protein (cupin superfamily)
MSAKTAPLQARIVTPEEAASLKAFGLDLKVLLTTEATGGAVSVLMGWHKPGEGPSDHVHFSQEEIFFIVEGTYELTVGDQTTTAGPGTIVFIPRNVVHRFKNAGETIACMLDWSLPGGQDQYFKAMAELAPGDEFVYLLIAWRARGHRVRNQAQAAETIRLLRMSTPWRSIGTRRLSSASKREDGVGTRSETQSERSGVMSKLFIAALSLVTMISLSATVGMAQTSCPAEVASAKAMLTQTAKSQDIQSPRSLAGVRSQDVQSPRSQDIQSPRSQDIQSPRGQDIQSPRSQDIQSPRSQDIQSPRSANYKKASTLVSEAEVACKAGKSSVAADKAKAAMDLLKK